MQTPYECLQQHGWMLMSGMYEMYMFQKSWILVSFMVQFSDTLVYAVY